MGLMVAIKSFFKALGNPKKAEEFVHGKQVKEEEQKTLDDLSHLRLLSLMQHKGRLIDFLKEDLSPYSDVQVGQAVRKIHSDCGKSLEEFITVRPIFEDQEGNSVTIPAGYDPMQIKVTGKLNGKAPYKGVLRHKGWKAHKRSLPKQFGDLENEVLAPAEVEVQ